MSCGIPSSWASRSSGQDVSLLENDLRRHAGQAGYQGGFISHYLVKVIYPPGLTRGMQIGLGLLVLLVAVIGYRGFLRRHPPGRRGYGHASGLDH